MDPSSRSSSPSRSVSEAYQSIFTNYSRPHVHKDRYWLHVGLFLITLVSCVYAGAELTGRLLVYQRLGLSAWVADGLRYALPLLTFLTFHEFGHYFAARFSRVSTTLPYYIPFPFFFLPIFNIGTFGAVIRIREPIPSTTKLFDIGVWGPLAGFLVALVVVVYAFATLPPPDYILQVTIPGHDEVHRHVIETGEFPPAAPGEFAIYVGQTPLFWALSQIFNNVPPMYEIYHYPLLFAGWLALFFTALNMLPVGQLDGGHIVYAMVGPKWHARIARGFVILLLFSASIGFVEGMRPFFEELHAYGELLMWTTLGAILVYFLNRIFLGDLNAIAIALSSLVIATALSIRMYPPIIEWGYSGWFVWCILIVWLIKVDHPPVLYHEPLTPARRALGVLSLIIFVLCFSIKPFYIV